MAEVVVARGLTKRWGTSRVFDNADLVIGDGVTGLLGANGAGKTTLLGMILGLHHPEAGSLQVLGLDPRTAGPEVRSRIGYAAEHESLPPDVRAHDFVRHVAELHGIPRKVAVARASDALFEVGLGEERFRPLGTMSTGQKQRVKLAQAIVHDPAIVLLDEPTNGLDPLQRDQLLAVVRRCGHELGLNVVLSSHLLDEVERTCDRVVILAAGHATVAGEMSAIEHEGADVEVEVVGLVAAACLALAREGLTVSGTDGDIVRVTYQDQSTFDAIARGLAASAIGIRRLQRTRGTLEDAFLEASST